VNELRERGIYKTPTGREVVASCKRQSVFQIGKTVIETGKGYVFFLFSRYAWAFHAQPDYMVDDAGRVLPDEQIPNWRAEDLIDTGHTAGAH